MGEAARPVQKAWPTNPSAVTGPAALERERRLTRKAKTSQDARRRFCRSAKTRGTDLPFVSTPTRLKMMV
jgi:hypothetical protein